MAHPLTPISTSGGHPDSPRYAFHVGFRQKKPYNLFTTMRRGESVYNLWPGYDRARGGDVPGQFSFFNTGQTLGWMENTGIGYMGTLETRAYNRFVDKFQGATADLGVTLAEHKSAKRMVTNRALQLLGLATLLAKRDFRKAYNLAGRPFSRRPQAKEFADLWLEWSWGWRPTIEDIGNALDTIQRPIKPNYFKGTATDKSSWYPVNSVVSGTGVGYSYTRWHEERWTATWRCSTGARVDITNPNLALANRLGITNPFATAWAVQPFSFIVDKYVNIGQMLNQIDDFLGFSVSERWSSHRIQIDSYGARIEHRQDFPFPTGARYVQYDFRAAGRSVFKRRTIGLVTPSFTFRQPSIGGLGEAVSYFALLTQLLSSKRK